MLYVLCCAMVARANVLLLVVDLWKVVVMVWGCFAIPLAYMRSVAYYSQSMFVQTF